MKRSSLIASARNMGVIDGSHRSLGRCNMDEPVG